MDGTRIADLDELSTDDTFLFRVRPVDRDGASDGAGASDGSSDGEASGDGSTAPAAASAASGGDTSDDEREAILLRLADKDGAPTGDVVCWFNYCQHFTHIKLDKGSGAPVRDDEVVCANHGAMFETDSGLCTFGPCEGAYLNGIDVAVADDGVYLTDDAYAFAGTGPVDTDDDMSSSSNVVL